MRSAMKIRLFLVDDDAVYLKSLEIEFLQHEEYVVETFATGEDCLAALSHKPDVIILDYLLDGIVKNVMNGIEVLDEIKTFDPGIPVIILSAQDKIEVAVDCMHHLAYDYVVKSETAFVRLQKIINTIYKFRKIEKELNWYMERM